MKKLFFFNLMFFKNWRPRNVQKMEPDLRFAFDALIAMVKD